MNTKGLKIRTTIFFFIIVAIAMMGFEIFNKFQEKDGKLNATYTAEATIRNIETQISRYLENSDLLKNIISSKGGISDGQFTALAELMKENKKVIEAYELAPDGVVEKVYPYKGNEKAKGLDMLKLPERKTEALLAKESGKYTIAGPYELKQGGIGALIFDPIYIGEGEDKEFWGFSILVLNWERFLEELQIEKLEATNYQFDVWKKDAQGNKITIMNDGYGNVKNALNVSCSVPNDNWYFDIYPKGGWIPLRLKVLEGVLSVIIAVFFAIGYWQMEMRKRREAVYAKKLEKSVKEAQAANEAKTRFLFNMSHDIRTPMNAIIGYSNLLEDSLDQKEVARSYIHKIKASNNMLLSLINYILEMARIESGKVGLKEEKANLGKFIEVLKAVSEPLVAEKQLDISWELDVQHEDILCDMTKLREIVLNIVSNAIKYTPKGGKVSLTITETTAEKPEYATYCFVVADNGIGMHEEYLPHIFEEFSRERTSTESKVVGAGLGLPIVKSLVDMMKGRIEVESRLNEGTKFTIYLSFPIAADADGDVDADDEEEIREHQKNVELTGRRLLLVEDNELNAEIAKELLTRQGAKIDWAKNGKECLAMLEQKPELYYEVILMDIQMPVMNGYETTKAIRKLPNKNATLPIIAMTANAFKEDEERCLEVGMNAHLAKPLDIGLVITTIGRFVKK